MHTAKVRRIGAKAQRGEYVGTEIDQQNLDDRQRQGMPSKAKAR